MSEPDPPRRTEQPEDRLTRICDAMTKTFDLHLEQREDDKVIIFIEDGVRAGIVLHGYNDDFDALIALLVHLRSIFRANGQDLQLMALGDEGVDVFDG